MVRLLPFAIAAVLVTAGCTSRSGSGASETDPPAETTTTAISTTTTTTTSAEPAAPVPAPENAADGTDYAACADGTCEVYVAGEAVIPLDPAFGIPTMRLLLNAGRITIDEGDGAIAQFGPGGVYGSGDLTIELLSADTAGGIVAFSVGQR